MYIYSTLCAIFVLDGESLLKFNWRPTIVLCWQNCKTACLFLFRIISDKTHVT